MYSLDVTKISYMADKTEQNANILFSWEEKHQAIDKVHRYIYIY